MRPSENVTLVLPAAVVERLLAQKQLCVEDFRCLDCTAKAQVKRMLLNNICVQIQQEGERQGRFHEKRLGGLASKNG